MGKLSTFLSVLSMLKTFFLKPLGGGKTPCPPPSAYAPARPNVIRPDFDLECRQVDLSRRLGGNLTSPDLEKIDLSRLQSDLDNKWRNTNWRNHARFSMWYGACVHVACPSYLSIANANCEVVCACVCMVIGVGGSEQGLQPTGDRSPTFRTGDNPLLCLMRW